MSRTNQSNNRCQCGASKQKNGKCSAGHDGSTCRCGALKINGKCVYCPSNLKKPGYQCDDDWCDYVNQRAPCPAGHLRYCDKCNDPCDDSHIYCVSKTATAVTMWD